MSDKFKAGDTAYTIHGGEVEVIAFAGGKWLAYPIRDTDEGPQYGRSMEYSALYKEPPTERLHGVCAELQRNIVSAQHELHALETATRKAKAAHEETMKRLGSYQGLEMLEDCVAGNIKWFATCEDGGKIRVETAADATAGTDFRGCRDGSIRLVHAKAWNGTVTWGINRHSDGSGRDDKRCYPCVERETAVAIAAQWLAAIFAEYAEKNVYYIDRAIESAELLGLVVPAPVKAKRQAELREGLQSNVESAEKKLAEFRARLAAFDTDA